MDFGLRALVEWQEGLVGKFARVIVIDLVIMANCDSMIRYNGQMLQMCIFTCYVIRLVPWYAAVLLLVQLLNGQTIMETWRWSWSSIWPSKTLILQLISMKEITTVMENAMKCYWSQTKLFCYVIRYSGWLIRLECPVCLRKPDPRTNCTLLRKPGWIIFEKLIFLRTDRKTVPWTSCTFLT